jgi:putative toxin-antitoxin system antitoxin component (TIGR02293 family)
MIPKLINPSSNEQDTVFKWLDIKRKTPRPANSSFAYMRIIKGGLKSKSIKSFIKHSNLTQKQVSRLIHISERTLQRNAPEKVINIGISEKLVELTRLFHKGIEVFNDKEKFNTWLFRPNKSLEDQKPIELIETSLGIDLVFDELLKIEHGVFS